MGRLSVDIIKSGGYKLSALEIESTLLTHPAIRECAVVGVADDTWGEAVAVAIVTRDGESIELPALKEWATERMSAYKIPKLLLLLEDLPKNAMGKVTKPAIQNLFD
jgi:malonyl-CoA/methylmalonyl-CoA synthetase